MIRILQHGPVLEWRYASDHPVLSLLTKPFWTSCYLLDGLLVDSLAPAALPRTRELIRSLSEQERVQKCVLTHSHEDHSGGARWLCEELGVPVFAHPQTRERLREGFAYPYYRRWAWGAHLNPTGKILALSEPVLSTRSGRYRLEVVDLPGHEVGAIGLVERTQGWAFLGDAAMPRYRMLFGNRSEVQEDIQGIYLSLKRLLEVLRASPRGEVRLFLAGRDPVEDGLRFLQDRITEIDDLHHYAQRLHAQGLDEPAIAKQMFGREGPERFLTRGDLSHLNLVRSLLKWS